MGKAAESIYNGKHCVVPLAEVQHVEKLKRGPYPGEAGLQPNGLHVITRITVYASQEDTWMNPIYIEEDEAALFMSSWCRYRSEIESHSLDSGSTNMDHDEDQHEIRMTDDPIYRDWYKKDQQRKEIEEHGIDEK